MAEILCSSVEASKASFCKSPAMMYKRGRWEMLDGLFSNLPSNPRKKLFQAQNNISGICNVLGHTTEYEWSLPAIVARSEFSISNTTIPCHT